MRLRREYRFEAATSCRATPAPARACTATATASSSSWKAYRRHLGDGDRPSGDLDLVVKERVLDLSTTATERRAGEPDAEWISV